MTRTTLLSAYLGRNAATQVLDGNVCRGRGKRIEAVVLVVDVREFSIRSDREDSEHVLALLNEVYDLLVMCIHADGGEVLKFLGDGLLAIFSVQACGGASPAAKCALAVAQRILRDLHTLNDERSQKCSIRSASGSAFISGKYLR
jgi:adenylate cyclase